MLTFWVGWVSLGLAVASFVVFAITTLSHRPVAGGPPAAHAGFDLSGWAKVGEAIAKIIDAVRQAGPSLSALLASIVFALIALYASQHIPPAPEPPHKTAGAAATSERCTVAGFADGANAIPAASEGDALSGFSEDPPGCVSGFLSRLAKEDPLAVMLIGRVDKRELRADTRLAYGSNFNLAYQRALAMKDYLTARYQQAVAGKQPSASSKDVPAKWIALAAGPAKLGRDAVPAIMTRDRCVEILALWSGAAPQP